MTAQASNGRRSRRSILILFARAGAGIAVSAAGLRAWRATAHQAATHIDAAATITPEDAFMATNSSANASAPTVAFVHGAFADSSSWAGVIQRLQAAGIAVTALANPLRGISYDSAYVASALQQIPGPVLAVGHSYGGAIISNAANNAPNVVGLVFVAAFAPDEGEVLGQVEQGSQDSILGSAQAALNYPTGNGGETAVEFAIIPAKLQAAFAADLSAAQAALLAATQRPVAQLAFTEPSGPPAWKTLPSWAVVATEDKAAGTDVIRAQARRAGATITELKGSHVIMISQPQAVTDVIMKAIAMVSAGSAVMLGRSSG